MMTIDQQKERDALNDALHYMSRTKEMTFYNGTDRSSIFKAAQSYADHLEEIQALKSGEWVLVPVEPDRNMLAAAKDALLECHAGHIDYIATWENQQDEVVKFVACPTEEYKAMIAARPNVKENDDE